MGIKIKNNYRAKMLHSKSTIPVVIVASSILLIWKLNFICLFDIKLGKRWIWKWQSYANNLTYEPWLQNFQYQTEKKKKKRCPRKEQNRKDENEKMPIWYIGKIRFFTLFSIWLTWEGSEIKKKKKKERRLRCLFCFSSTSNDHKREGVVQNGCCNARWHE